MTYRENDEITYEYDDNAPIYLPTANAGASNIKEIRERKSPKRKKSSNNKYVYRFSKEGKLADGVYRPGKRSIYARIRESEQVVADYRKDEQELARQMLNE